MMEWTDRHCRFFHRLLTRRARLYTEMITTGAVLQHQPGRVAAVEIESAVLRASTYFDEFNHKPLANPAVRPVVADGRTFLLTDPGRYDAIVSEPSSPWMTIAANLFTREYFRDIKRRLAPNGIFCQWAQLYELAPWNIKTIYRTVRDEFKFVYVFAAEDLSSDTILIATQEPLKLDLAAVERALSHPQTRAEAKRGLLESPHDVFAYLLLAPDEVESFTTGSPINTDDNARIEFSAPRDLLGLVPDRSPVGYENAGIRVGIDLVDYRPTPDRRMVRPAELDRGKFERFAKRRGVAVGRDRVMLVFRYRVGHLGMVADLDHPRILDRDVLDDDRVGDPPCPPFRP